MPDFLDDVRHPSCPAATCMAGRAVLPGLVAIGVDLQGGVARVDTHPPHLSPGSIPRGAPVEPASPNPGGNYDDAFLLPCLIDKYSPSSIDAGNLMDSTCSRKTSTSLMS